MNHGEGVHRVPLAHHSTQSSTRTTSQIVRRSPMSSGLGSLGVGAWRARPASSASDINSGSQPASGADNRDSSCAARRDDVAWPLDGNRLEQSRGRQPEAAPQHGPQGAVGTHLLAGRRADGDRRFVEALGPDLAHFGRGRAEGEPFRDSDQPLVAQLQPGDLALAHRRGIRAPDQPDADVVGHVDEIAGADGAAPECREHHDLAGCGPLHAEPAHGVTDRVAQVRPREGGAYGGRSQLVFRAARCDRPARPRAPHGRPTRLRGPA